MSQSVDAGPWERHGWLMGVVWLVFLVFPVLGVIADAPGPWRTGIALGLIVVFAGCYVHGFRTFGDRPGDSMWRQAGPQLGLLTALMVLTVLVGGLSGLGMATYLATFGVFALPLPVGVAWSGLVVIATTVWVALAGQLDDFWIMPLIVASVSAGVLVVRTLEASQERHRAGQEHVALIAERERVARDVHDVLGHSLTVVVMKSQVAERLVDHDPEAARRELHEIRSLAREALAEVRATVGGLRVARLGEELARARAALADAGIEATVPDDPQVVDPRHRIVLAWVLREAVTNVVRHSGATHCLVELDEHRLVVRDDGCGLGRAGSAADRHGHGLRGVRERLAEAGGELVLVSEVDGQPGRGTRLEATL